MFGLIYHDITWKVSQKFPVFKRSFTFFLSIIRSEQVLLSRPTGHNFGNNKLLSPKYEISKPD